MINLDYHKQLKYGIDVDWCKTSPGRSAMAKSRDAGVNVPALFKARGFDHVRIRVADHVDADLCLLPEMVVITHQCLESGLTPIIAYQAAGFKDNPLSDDALNDVVSWWVTVSKAFDPALELGFNLIIETTGELLRSNNARLNLCYLRCAEAIRLHSSNRVLICPSNKISDPYQLPSLALPAPTDRAIAEWHMYAAGPSRDTKAKLWTTGTDAEKKLITDRIDFAAAWSAKLGVPTWVGAWMVADFNDEDTAPKTHDDGAPASANYSIEDQIAFAKFMSDQLRAANIPFAINSDTKYFDREKNTWYDSVSPVLAAIIGDQTEG